MKIVSMCFFLAKPAMRAKQLRREIAELKMQSYN